MSFAVLETLLRLFPPALIRDDIYYRYDKDVGWMPAPNQNSKNYNNCLEISPIFFNSNGFRDKEWINNQDYKIAILGDSFMQGVHIPEGMYASAVLERLLNIQTLNGGIENFSTVNEYLLFKKYLLPYHPNVVIMFVYAMNDVLDNSYALSSRRNLWPTARLIGSDNAEIIYPEVKAIEKFDTTRAVIKKYSK